MSSLTVHALEIVFLLLLLFVVAFGTVAKRLQIPYPIIMVVGGALLALFPVLPRVSLNPDFVFYVVLPPLLYAAAWVTSWREFRNNIVNISFLAFGLVFFTVAGVAYGAPYLFPGFDWKVGLVLGAVVAPTDAIAATSIAERIGIPKRLKEILEGESLVNDATGLLALEFGIAILNGEHAPSLGASVARLSYLTVAGLAIGLAIGWVVYHIERRLDEGPIEIALSILVPYAAYLGAEAAHASGVLAVVACGLYLSRRSSEFYSPGVRLQAWAVWDALSFILNGFVFLLIGLQLPNVLSGIRGYSMKSLFLYGGLFSGLLIGLRMAWVFPGSRLACFIRTYVTRQPTPRPTPRGAMVIGWTGMRGVIALAAAISLPHALADGSPFTQRNFIIFLAFSAIFVTLVLQGLTLPPLVRFLELAGSPARNEEEENARRKMLEAALSYLEDSRARDGDGFDDLYDDLVGHYQQRLNAIALDPNEKSNEVELHHRLADISRDLLRVERQTVVRLRNEGKISDETLRDLEHELDLRKAGAAARALKRNV